MRRFLVSFSVVALVLGFIAIPNASAQQSFSLYLGGFVPSSYGARGPNDVLFQDSLTLSTLNNLNVGGIDLSQFDGVTGGGEWLVRLGRNFEVGLGLGFYQKTVPTTYTNLTDSAGNNINQDLRLRIVPFTATARFLPFGSRGSFQPYFGAGVAVYAWRYNESGSFVDANNNILPPGSFTGSGGAVGPVVLVGVRVPVGPTRLGGEIRWQGGSATLPADQGFAGSQIYLGGVNYLFVVNIPF